MTDNWWKAVMRAAPKIWRGTYLPEIKPFKSLFNLRCHFRFPGRWKCIWIKQTNKINLNLPTSCSTKIQDPARNSNCSRCNSLRPARRRRASSGPRACALRLLLLLILLLLLLLLLLLILLLLLLLLLLRQQLLWKEPRNHVNQWRQQGNLCIETCGKVLVD